MSMFPAIKSNTHILPDAARRIFSREGNHAPPGHYTDRQETVATSALEPHTMNLKHIITGLAGLLTIALTGCASQQVTSDFGKITTSERGHSTDTTRSGEMSGIGFVHRY